MGLFSKKDPCAICGGKVSGLFPWKVDGQLVCNECHGIVDLPDNMEKGITLEEFKEYCQFRAENQQLKDDFVISDTVDFGLLDTKIVFDYEHHLFCFDKRLNKTIFEGAQLISFTIKEDEALLYQGSAEALVRYVSKVPEWAMNMAPQIAQIVSQREMHETIARLANQDRDGDGVPDNPRHIRRMINIPEPFKKFNVELRFEHPYWKSMTCDMDGPTFNLDYPDIDDYLREYSENMEEMETLVLALMQVAFPNAPERMAGEAAPQANAQSAAGAEDPVAEIKRYKGLLTDGIITEEEFTAKKRQLLGI